MRMTKSKKNMVRQKKDWSDYVIRFDQDQEKPEVSENVSKSTEQRRKRKFVDANPSSVIQGSAALDYEDQDFTEAAQVLRELHKNPELGPKLLNLVKQIKKGKDSEKSINSGSKKNVGRQIKKKVENGINTSFFSFFIIIYFRSGFVTNVTMAVTRVDV